LATLNDEECQVYAKTEEECEEELTARMTLEHALRIKHNLKELEAFLKNSVFVDSVKEKREKEQKSHWYNDYKEFYSH
jgi:hypothetical protein